ncbi:MAG TPA: EAL domain-containing protein [Burkholderiales bacterium]|nr:EAL domain-containing protein [Burkholderiales bacterium]
MTKSVIALAHGLGLKVVAEGVETADQLAYLVEHGCDAGQGYLFARPMPAGEISKILSEGRLPAADGTAS